MSYEFAIFGLWYIAGPVIQYATYTQGVGAPTGVTYSTFGNALLAIYQVRIGARTTSCESRSHRDCVTFMLPASGWQVLVKDNWGENMFYAIQSTGNASIALFALVEVLLASILFTNLFVGVICSVLCRDVGVDSSYREVEQKIVSHDIIRRVLLRLRLMSRVRVAAQEFRERAAAASQPQWG